MPSSTDAHERDEFALPVTALAAVRRSLAEDVGPDAAAHALLRAGHAAGDALFALLLQPRGAPRGSREDALEMLGETAAPAFWRRLSELFETRGWGRLSFEPLHPGLASLVSSDWAEADPDAAQSRPSCFFTAGVLANLLGHTAGEPTAVLEVECRSRGDACCRFVFGGGEVLDRVYEEIAAGTDLEGALRGLA